MYNLELTKKAENKLNNLKINDTGNGNTQWGSHGTDISTLGNITNNMYTDILSIEIPNGDHIELIYLHFEI